MSEWQRISELSRLFGEALGVIKGTSMRGDIGEEWRNKLAAIAEELDRKYRELVRRSEPTNAAPPQKVSE